MPRVGSQGDQLDSPLVNYNEHKLYNILNAHGLGVYYAITASHGMNHRMGLRDENHRMGPCSKILHPSHCGTLTR
jgi:hypothetical protein